MKPLRPTPLFWLLPLALAAVMSGCAASDGGPRTRLGSLPFPGIFSLYEAADPGNLGVHCSGSPLLRLGHRGEQPRGTLYTRRAGFIDLSHLRETIDWVSFFHTRNLHALSQVEMDGPATAVYSFSYCLAKFEVTFTPPQWWNAAPLEERQQIIEELAIRSAQRLSVVTTTWHEAATWLGYQTVPGISEAGSAFTWDDGTAHIVGAIVGGRALRDIGTQWDEAVTRELDDELLELDVVSREEFRDAALIVRERWWKQGVAVRRDFDVGLEDGHKVPWLVPEFGTDAAMLMLPTFENVCGRDLTGATELRITPARWVMRRLMDETDPAASLEGEAGLLKAVELVREQMRAKFGEGFDQP